MVKTVSIAISASPAGKLPAVLAFVVGAAFAASPDLLGLRPVPARATEPAVLAIEAGTQLRCRQNDLECSSAETVDIPPDDRRGGVICLN